jgi:pSer/pThr/pTyr-binding forkhead associated (FHA) protein
MVAMERRSMKIRLKVLKGSNAGKEVKIPTPECLIGRSSDCHLRPKSDAISRKHCAILVEDGTVRLRDFGSKNGTYLNERRVEGELVVKSGDVLKFGPLSFEVLIDRSLGGEKKPKVSSIREAAARTTESGGDSGKFVEDDISDWLEEADKIERDRRLADPDTRQLKLDETDQVTLQKSIEERAKVASQKASDGANDVSPKDAKKKKGPGKLPQRPEMMPKDSREAAAVMLRKFFNNR